MARGVAAAVPGTGSREDARRPGRRKVDRARDLAIGQPTRLGAYSPVKRGSRFSANAIIASAVSRDENINACATSSNSSASAIV